jgi:hypothetical protein
MNHEPIPPRLDTIHSYSKGWRGGFAAGRWVGWCEAVGSRIAYVAAGAALVLLLPHLAKWTGQ